MASGNKILAHRAVIPFVCLGLGTLSLIFLIGARQPTRVFQPSVDLSSQPRQQVETVPQPNSNQDLKQSSRAELPVPWMWHIERSWYDAMIHAVARTHGVDPALVKAVVQVESAFDPEAVSRDGARGLMQVLPSTAARYQFHKHDLDNPYLNLHAGVRYLKFLLETFDGDVRLAVAAYNAGENAVRRHDGVPPYRETRDYVYKVLGLHNIYKLKPPLG